MCQELKEVAYHEAGHAVLMRHFGFPVIEVEVHWNDEDGRWDGKTFRDTTLENEKSSSEESEEKTGFCIDLSLQINESIIAIAGCLSQTKYLARLKFADAVFAIDQEWHQLFAWMMDKSPEMQQPFQFSFRTSNDPVLINAHPRSFGGRDRTEFLKVTHQIEIIPLVSLDRFNKLLQENLVEAMKMLDEPQTWDGIIALSEALLEGCSENDRRCSITTRIEELLAGE